MKWIAPHGAATSDERYKNAEPLVAGSNPDAAFFNDVLDELLAVITTASMTPTDQNMHQIADAIVYLTERAATSGVTKGSFWFGKTTANFSVPAPTTVGQTYIDFTDLKTYISNDGSTWTQSGTFVPPTGIDFTILITSKFWDITEQAGQQGGEAKYNHTDDVWAYWPKIISFQDAALTGTPTTTKPAATSSTSDTKIPTTGWVNDPTTANNVVHRSGYGEVITDPKRFHTSDDVPICLRNTTDDSNVAPSTQKATTVGIEDKNGKWQGGFEHYHHPDGTMVTQLAVRKQNDSGENYAHISVAIRSDGSTWTNAPTPYTYSNDTNIATTAFVRNLLDAIYPIGAIYLSITNYCPLQGICGNWELIQAGRALWTGNGQTGNYSWTGDKETAAHNVIWQQLPNVSGYATWDGTQNFAGAGGFAYSSVNTGVATGVGSGYSQFRTILDFTASASSSIYSGTRVQPEAYVVNVWRRIS